jgi:hypothetical protein
MKYFKIIFSVFAIIIIMSSCSNTKTINNSGNKSISSSTSNKSITKNTTSSSSTIQNSKNTPNNIVKEAVPEAENVPKLFYNYLNNKEYDKAIALLSAALKFEGDPSQRKYLENLENTTFIKFKDITDNGGYLDSSQQQYFAIKIYYAELTIQVKDKNLVPGLLGTQYRRMVVVKVTKDSPWTLDADESTPQIQ